MTYRTWLALGAIAVLTGCTASPSSVAQQTSPITSPSPVASTEPQADPSNAIAALQAVDSATDVGVNLVNYTQLVTAAKTQVDLYVSKDSSSDLSTTLRNAIDGHITALQWWRCDLEEQLSSSGTNPQADCRDAVLPQIFTLYPDIQAKAEPAIADNAKRLQQQGLTQKHKSPALDQNAVLKLIWVHTSAETEKALKSQG